MPDIITYGTVINKTWFERNWMACGHGAQSPKPLSFCRTSIPSQQWPTREPRWKPQAVRPKFEQSGAFAAWGGPIVSLLSDPAGVEWWECIASACSLLYGLDLRIKKPPSSGLAPQVQIHFTWIQIHSGWVSLAGFTICSPPAVKTQSSALQNQAQLTVRCARLIGSAKPDITHVLVSYLRRCLSHRRMPSPWKYRSLLLSSPAGRRSASRSCPECICRCRYTSQGIPLQGKQPHIQMHWRHKATQPGKGLIKQLFPFAFGLFLHSHLVSSHLEWTFPVRYQDGGDHLMGCCLPGGPHSTASLIGSREWWALGRQWDFPASLVVKLTLPS